MGHIGENNEEEEEDAKDAIGVLNFRFLKTLNL